MQAHYYTDAQNWPWKASPEAVFAATGASVVEADQKRGAAHFFNFEGTGLVLKQYRRGGWPSRLIFDGYFFTGWTRTRMGREFELLRQLRRLGLPVPKPVAGRCRRRFFLYRGDLITERLNGTETLGSRLRREPLPPAEWALLGETVARFHHHGLFHADLNIENILLGGTFGVALIDFDKSRFRPTPGDRWILANNERLLRSLNKWQARHDTVHFSLADWQCYLDAHARSLRDFRHARP